MFTQGKRVTPSNAFELSARLCVNSWDFHCLSWMNLWCCRPRFSYTELLAFLLSFLVHLALYCLWPNFSYAEFCRNVHRSFFPILRRIYFLFLFTFLSLFCLLLTTWRVTFPFFLRFARKILLKVKNFSSNGVHDHYAISTGSILRLLFLLHSSLGKFPCCFLVLYAKFSCLCCWCRHFYISMPSISHFLVNQRTERFLPRIHSDRIYGYLSSSKKSLRFSRSLDLVSVIHIESAPTAAAAG